MRKPIAVLVADVHYSLLTLELASAAMRQAINKANSLGVRLVVAGDLHDTKANMRAECVNEMLEVFSECKTPAYVIVGNHCKINEKSQEHSLNFLKDKVTIVDKHIFDQHMHMLPYLSDQKEFIKHVEMIPKGSIVICHQGVQSAYMGHYVQDKTSVFPNVFDGLTVKSGHYHRRQTIKCGETGTFTYIGNPYTLNFGEASDPEKGFQVLYDDGSLEFIPTNLRKHVVIDIDYEELRVICNPPHILDHGSEDLNDLRIVNYSEQEYKIDPLFTLPKRFNFDRKLDLVWIKIRGPKKWLAECTKDMFMPHSNYKLDLIPTDIESTAPTKVETLTDGEILDALIDSTSEAEPEKSALKALWRDLIE